MPGDFTLGCLLGQYDKAQSFDVASKASPIATGDVGSWFMPTSSEFKNTATDVHSSGQGIYTHVVGGGGAIILLQYNHGYANDVLGRWFPDVATHTFQTDAWARMATSAGYVFLDFPSMVDVPTITITRASSLSPHRLYSANAHATEGEPIVRFIQTAPVVNDLLLVDDVLTQTDLITLYPEFDFIEESRLPAARHRTQGGVLHTYQWTRHWAWRVPLRFLSNSHADLINWWWVNGFALAFMLDTSDQNTVYTAKIVNETQPIGSKIKPYALNAGGWAGVLELESLDQGSLVF